MMSMPEDPQTYSSGGGGPAGSVTGSNPGRYEPGPTDTMQGLEIASQQGSNFGGGPMDPNLPDLGPNMDLSFQGDMHPPHAQPSQQQQQQQQQPPHPSQQGQPGQDQMAAWFDTDL